MSILHYGALWMHGTQAQMLYDDVRGNASDAEKTDEDYTAAFLKFRRSDVKLKMLAKTASLSDEGVLVQGYLFEGATRASDLTQALVRPNGSALVAGVEEYAGPTKVKVVRGTGKDRTTVSYFV
jgi:hypothetical protein